MSAAILHVVVAVATTAAAVVVAATVVVQLVGQLLLPLPSPLPAFSG